MSVLETSGLTKYYGETRGIEDLSLTVEEGEVFGFLGPNGAGKTTTIRTLLGFIAPTEGTATVLGRDACDEKEQCGDEPEPEPIVGAFRCAHADGTPPLLLEGEMVFSSPWGTLRPSEIMTLRISTLDSKSEPIPDDIFEPNKEFSLYRSQAGLPIKVATLSPYMVNISSYQTGGEYYELALDTNKTQFFEQCEEDVDYFLTDNVHNFVNYDVSHLPT